MVSIAQHVAARDGRGTLYVIATPIGNLADLSPRASGILQRIDIIAAEDTRVSRRLLGERAQPVRMISVNEHNEQSAVAGLLASLEGGLDVALVSDAGTPLVSDPGYRLVSAAHEAGLTVCPVPGPCAAITALSAAGLPTDHFFFEGFLPARAGARRRRLGELADLKATLVFYVPARDLGPVLDDMVGTLDGQRAATLARELTKLHETIHRSSLSGLLDFVRSDADQLRGEAVLVVAGSAVAAPAIDVRRLAAELAAELPPSRAAGMLARLSDMNRQQAWALIQSLGTSGAP